jgi:hypothetical protein
MCLISWGILLGFTFTALVGILCASFARYLRGRSRYKGEIKRLEAMWVVQSLELADVGKLIEQSKKKDGRSSAELCGEACSLHLSLDSKYRANPRPALVLPSYSDSVRWRRAETL